ncbi:MAG: DUF4296 domain-containing protein [Terrimonas sp.]|nr:DUF4296 domain-containing protein [Terrimonas sp.]OJY99155.1 MAG: hypothetical protein BGP13_24235 [Sphingobacteriales bacterium 40-81]
MKVHLMFVFCLFLLSACVKSKSGSDIIASDKMGSVIFDMNVAEEFVSIYVAKDSSKDKKAELNKEYQKIYLLYEITEQQFKNSYDYYKAHPGAYKIVIDSLNAKAQRRREDLYRMPNS